MSICLQKASLFVFDDEHFNETMLQQQMQATISTADALA